MGELFLKPQFRTRLGFGNLRRLNAILSKSKFGLIHSRSFRCVKLTLLRCRRIPASAVIHPHPPLMLSMWHIRLWWVRPRRSVNPPVL